MAVADDDRSDAIFIRSESDAWYWFERATKGEELPDIPVLVFDGWPSFEISFDGKDWHGTVPSRVMSPLLEVQRDLHRSYVNLCYGMPNLRKLREEDRDGLEIIVEVDKGSSKYKAPLSEQLTKLAQDAIKGMGSRDKLIAILGIALVWGATDVNKAWVAQRQEEKQAEKTVKLSQEETKRLEVFSAATKEAPILRDAKADFEASQNRLLKTLKPADKVVSMGVKLTGREANDITHEEHARSQVTTITGSFRVLANNAAKGAGFRIKVARISDGLIFSADVPLELDIAQKNLIQRSEWSKGAVAVDLEIHANMLRGKVSNAIIVSAAESS